MPREDVELVRRMYDAFHSGDAARALSYFSPDVLFDASARPDATVVQGRKDLNRAIAEWIGAFDDWGEEIEEIRDLGGRVLVVLTQRGRGKGSGLEIEQQYAVVYELENRQITRATLHLSEHDALEAVGPGD